MGFGAQISFVGLLLIASILGSTDPIAVGALLKELGAPHKLNILIEGESLINDGTSLICFQTLAEIYAGRFPTPLKVLTDTLTLCVGGPAVGIGAGFLFYLWMGRINKDGVLVVSLTLINCFLVFFVCEYFSWNVSGILAIVLSSLLQSSKGKIRIMADELWAVVDTVWKFAQFVGESVLFVVTGIFIGEEFIRHNAHEDFFHDVLRALLFFALMNIARLAVVLLFQPFYNNSRNAHEYKIGVRECVVIAYSGIRGAFPLIICLMVAKDESYPEHFRRTTVLVTITTIFMSVIFNGLTIKSLIGYLRVLRPNPVLANLRAMVQKDVYGHLAERVEELRRKPDLGAANWSLVQELCGLRGQLAVIERADGRLRETRAALNSGELLLTESRIRVLFFFKSLVHNALREATCSVESAQSLLHVVDLAEEDAHALLSLWTHLEALFASNIFLAVLDYLRQVPSLEPYARHPFNHELSLVYETLYNFTNCLESIVASRRALGNSGQFREVLAEVESNRELAARYMRALTEKHSVVIHLYQTRRAAKELVHFRRKLVKELLRTGVIDEGEQTEFLLQNRRMLAKIDNFGFGVSEGFVKELLGSNLLFCALSPADKELLCDKFVRITLNAGKSVFSKGEPARGIYIVLDGSLHELFEHGRAKLRVFGALLGVSYFVDDRREYKTSAQTLTKCTVGLVPDELLQNFAANYPELEKAIYYLCLQNVLVTRETDALSAEEIMGMLTYFEVVPLKAGERKVLDTGFLLLRGEVRVEKTVPGRSLEFSETFAAAGTEVGFCALPYHYDLNAEGADVLLQATADALIVGFALRRGREVESGRELSLRQSQKFFGEASASINKRFSRLSAPRLSK